MTSEKLRSALGTLRFSQMVVAELRDRFGDQFTEVEQALKDLSSAEEAAKRVAKEELGDGESFTAEELTVSVKHALTLDSTLVRKAVADGRVPNDPMLWKPAEVDVGYWDVLRKRKQIPEQVDAECRTALYQMRVSIKRAEEPSKAVAL